MRQFLVKSIDDKLHEIGNKLTKINFIYGWIDTLGNKYNKVFFLWICLRFDSKLISEQPSWYTQYL